MASVRLAVSVRVHRLRGVLWGTGRAAFLAVRHDGAEDREHRKCAEAVPGQLGDAHFEELVHVDGHHGHGRGLSLCVRLTRTQKYVRIILAPISSCKKTQIM